MTWAPDYVTLAEAKDYLRITDTNDDTLLALWITTASRAVDGFCGRQFGKTDSAESRTYTAQFDRHLACWVAEIDDLYDADGSTVAGPSAEVLTDYELEPTNGPRKDRPYERLLATSSGPYTINSDSWGWSAVPSAATTATLLQTARLAARRDSPYGIAGSPTEGSELRLLASLDPDLRTSLNRFRRNWWAA